MVGRSTFRSLYLTLLAGGLVVLGLGLTYLHSYLLFHSLAELFSIVIGCGVFMVAWNARRFLDDEYWLVIGIASLAVSGIDALHLLAYRGMGVFPGDDANLPTQLWIAARYLQSFSLLIAPALVGRRSKPRLVLAGYAIALSLLLASIFVWKIFPVCYVPGSGLTPFKKISEYVISAILLASIGFMLRKRQAFDPAMLRLLIGSIAFTIGSELLFTFYVGVYDVSNILGHLFKIQAFYLIYTAVIETSFVRPYDLLFRNVAQSEEALRRSNADLQSRNQDLDAFAHMVAHDLKNPIGLIMGFGQLLQDPRTREDQRDESLQVIAKQASKMNSIVDELLLLAETRKTDVPAAPLDMGSIAATACQRLESMIADCSAELILPESWPVAVGYAPWIEQVWVNYISNGVKYGGRPPRLVLGGERQPDGMVRFWVRDNGPGLTPEQQARLFEAFTRLDQSRATGYGLGLSIVRRIVEKLGGQVGIESTPGEGSAFTFTLPGSEVK